MAFADIPLVASDDLKDAARAWIDKLSVKNGAYPPDSYPNPGELLLHDLPILLSLSRCAALAYHNTQLEATAFREEFNPDEFEDLTLPKAEMIHKVPVIPTTIKTCLMCFVFI